MSDILFKTDEYVFSYRVAGILLHNGSVLLQKPTNDTGYAFPGGHVEFGETNEQTLTREFREEIGADVTVQALKGVGEIFFLWGNKPCHQICLFYKVELADDTQIPLQGLFLAKESPEKPSFDMEFRWIPLSEISNYEVYPENAKNLLKNCGVGVQHFVFREQVEAALQVEKDVMTKSR
jgi:ADP-ribose pyrophosphatase YjhB (NUDIX family)